MVKPVGINPETLPTRVTNRTDLDEAREWLTAVQANGGAGDGVAYETMAGARNVGMRIARALRHVVPDGQEPSVKTFGLDEAGDATGDPDAIVSYGFLVTLRNPSANGDGKSKGKGK